MSENAFYWNFNYFTSYTDSTTNEYKSCILRFGDDFDIHTAWTFQSQHCFTSGGSDQLQQHLGPLSYFDKLVTVYYWWDMKAVSTTETKIEFIGQCGAAAAT